MATTTITTSSTQQPVTVDANVAAALPKDADLVSADKFGASAWTVTFRLHVKLSNGSDQFFFLKTALRDHGRIMMEGEFNAMSELYKWAPDFVPQPYTWGQFAEAETPTYFFLCQFIPMHQSAMPDPKQLCASLAKLHRNSTSPNGKYGFHITTCQGRTTQRVDWDENWTTFFKKLIEHVMKADFETNGYWEDLDKVEERFVSQVIPRLLDALTSEGRSIEPSLIHSDLWEGNSGTSLETGKVYIFDSAAFYAHDEMEVADWRCYYNKISNQVYTRTYARFNSASEPKNEWEDRNRLYSVYYNIIYSVNHQNEGIAVRQLAYNDMYFLIDKFAPFPDDSGPTRLQESQMASLSSERDHTT